MKKWLLPLIAALFLAACSDEETTPTDATSFESVIDNNVIDIYPVDEPNEDVQSIIDITENTTFASFIYSMSDVSYLLLNSSEHVSITADDNERVLSIHLTRGEQKTGDIETEVYAVSFTHTYDTIKLFEGGKEIPFDIWTE
ncbi:hypothetical protein [Caryophanon latum]|uniref:Peptidylprolyl isomerase n=1 Tax=Caryophanon latum TaxID=33977 RepID=A0A1C0YEE6_9BACL|nr:hypothetical protein [Caryophanon latum]OCS85483.1 hypothetical protein A6K76_15145 [Caryophanon latum]